MKTIIAIVGMSGVGKDTAADYLCSKNGWNKIISHTTRPRREGEGRCMKCEGRRAMYEVRRAKDEGRTSHLSHRTSHLAPRTSHIFHTQSPSALTNTFAHAWYGGYEYWTYWSEFVADVPNVYVVDERSLMNLEFKRIGYESLYKSLNEHYGMNEVVKAFAENLRFRIVRVRITRPTLSDISEQRTNRDKDRVINDDGWDYDICNDSSLEDFYAKLDAISD